MSQIHELLKRKARAEESEAKLAKFTQFTKQHKKRTNLHQHRNHWMGEHKKLARERFELEQDVQKLLQDLKSTKCDVMMKPIEDAQSTVAVPVISDWIELHNDGLEERKNLAEEVFASLIGFKLKVQAQSAPTQTHISDWQADLDDMKGYLKQLKQDLVTDDETFSKLVANWTAQLSDKSTGGDPRFQVASLIEEKVVEIDNKLSQDDSYVDETLHSMLLESINAQHAAFCTKLDQFDDEIAEIQQKQQALKFNKADALKFKHLWKEYSLKGDAASTPAEFSNRLKVEFPRKNVSELQQYQWTYQHRKFTKRKKKALAGEHLKEIQALLANMEHALTFAAELHAANQRKAEEALQKEKEQQQLHQKLQLLREEHHAKEKEKLEAKILAQMEEEERQRVAQEKHESYMKVQLEKLSKYREEQREEELKLQEVKRKEHLLQLEKQAKLAQYNTERVSYRTGEFAKKQKQMEEKQLALQAEIKQREERIQALVDKVKVVAVADPKRLVQDTEAWKNKEDAEQMVHHQFGHHGYTDQTLFKDQRFKLQEALSRAGLMNTDYGRAMILTAKPFQPPRPDMKCT